jgi:hypothetical protein
MFVQPRHCFLLVSIPLQVETRDRLECHTDQLLISGLAIFASVDSTQPVASHVGVPAPVSGDDAFENGTISGNPEADVTRLNLGHFAHKPTTLAALPHQTLFLHEPFRSRSLDSAVSIDIKRNRDRAKGYPFADEFTEATLATLKRCVSCELTWTARKTASQMMTHIQSCGKKQGVTDNTLRILIRKEIDAASPPKIGPKSMGNVKFLPEDKASATQETLLEAVINDAAPKRRSGRRTVIETVKSVTETRDDILKKAQDVLRSHSSADLEPYTSRVSGRDEPRGISDDNTPLPQTQAFGQSALAAYSGNFSALRQPYLAAEAITHREDASFLNQEDRNSDVSPATQTMAPSKLQGALGLDTYEISVLSQAGAGSASSESINKYPPLDTVCSPHSSGARHAHFLSF